MLSREDILTANDVVEVIVDVPEWNGSVKIRTMTKAKQLQLRDNATVNGKVDGARLEVLMFVAGVIEPQFTAADYDALKEKNAKAMDRVLEKIMSSSGLNEESLKAAEKELLPQPGSAVPTSAG